MNLPEPSHAAARRGPSALQALLGLVLVLCMTGCATRSPRTSGTDDKPPVTKSGEADARDVQQLQAAVELVRKNQPRAALDGPLETLAQRYEHRYGHTGKHCFCAQTPATALVYLSAAAKTGQSAELLPMLWAQVFFLQGFALADLEQAEASRAALQRAVALSPRNAHFLNELAYNYQSRQQWSRALSLYKDAKRAADAFSPDQMKRQEQTRALRGQGFVLTERGKLDQAEAAYTKALSLDPDDRRALNELAYIRQLRRTGQKEPIKVYRDVPGS